MNRYAYLLLAGLLLPAAVFAQAPDGYFRYPALRGDTVVFTSEGDLWSVPAAGGAARRLTTHPAEETRAAISPDGKWLAFSAAYEGPVEAYAMPLEGGQPQRISFENSSAAVLGWTAQGEVLYSAVRAGGVVRTFVITAVNPQTLARRVFPLADANDAAVDDSGRWIYFVRFGLSVTQDNARGYRGGALAQLWRYALDGSKVEAERIGPENANVRRPMLWNGRVIVIADTDGLDNLWSLAADGSDPRPLTRHREFAVRTAQLDAGRVVYQSGADLRLFDVAGGSDRVLPIRLTSDFDQRRARWIDDPLRYVDSVTFAPAGDRIAVTARGRVTLASVGPRRRVDIAAPEGSRLSAAEISPDGKTVYAFCDASGEEEVWRFPADGGTGAKQLTDDGGSQRWRLSVSPDGRSLVHYDKRGRLYLLELASGRNRLVDDGGADGNEGYEDIAWSRDSRHVAFVRSNTVSRRSRIALLSIDDGRVQWLTSDKYESSSPFFSPDGHWLWFLSDREFRSTESSPWGDRNMGPVFTRRTKIYALALQENVRFPFQPEDELTPDSRKDGAKKDEQKPDDKKKGDDKKGKSEEAPAPKVPAIVRDGLAERLYEVPLDAGNYSNVQSNKDRLYYVERTGERAALKYVTIGSEKPTATEVLDNVSGYALSADGKKIYVRTPGSGDKNFGRFFIAEASGNFPTDRGKITVSIDDWTLRIDPRAEWRQMFSDAWRMHRDHFYDSRLRGVDWIAAKRRYEPLLARIADRNELADVLGQMMGELGALHSQVREGDFRHADDAAKPAGLGARFERAAGGWRVAHIYRTEVELPSERSPLQAPGVDVRVGDVVTAINGQPTADMRDLFDLLRNQAGKQVLLELKRGTGPAKRVVVVAADAQREERLRYNDWVQGARETVEQESEGKIGYLHLAAMGAGDLATFAREFYAQYSRDGLIVDVRRNRGGNIDSWIIEKLMRRAWMFWQRPIGQPYTNMQGAFRGHLVVLTDALTYSDGETFSMGVKTLKLGPLIGTRTAGAGVWLSDRNNLVDRGRARVAENPQYGMNGQWLIEGVGVEPDIVVDNLPHATFSGHDAQLQAGIDWIKRKLASDPIPPLKPQTIPPLKPDASP